MSAGACAILHQPRQLDALMKIAVVGTVGVPARYGGFETLAEQLARHVDHERYGLTIYCERTAYPEVTGHPGFAGHDRKFLPLRANGASSMVHDALAMAHAQFRVKADALLVLGYSGAWFLPLVRLARPRARIITNIDGMEWRRDKFSRPVRWLLRMLEWFAVRFSHEVIADNRALVDLAKQIHGVDARLIAYGGDHSLVNPVKFTDLMAGYALAVARIEPENNCHLILQACVLANHPMIFVGNWSSSEYGKELKLRFSGHEQLHLWDPIYDVGKLAFLRANAGVYLHGHSVGGTNPSLVEAVFHHERILAFDCVFNRATLSEAGGYFDNAEQLAEKLADGRSGLIESGRIDALRQEYVWRNIASAYVAILDPHA